MRLILVSALLAALASPAIGQDAPLKQTMSGHLARVYALSKLCPQVEGNVPMIERALVSVGADAKEAIASPEAEAAMVETAEFFKGKDRNYICMSALMMYGPKGSAFPGLMIERN